MDVAVAGQGYVGLPLAARAAEVGHRVVGYDVDLHRINRLTTGQSYVEDVTSSRLRAVGFDPFLPRAEPWRRLPDFDAFVFRTRRRAATGAVGTARP
ncbi:hypothetical protein [Kitasatospora sp. McL0602]|uniref:hypothetical protein n=1 Tax=Kitasatospora sp. McL0602 TaxID=3439530 RepID=UPI003F8973E7